VESIIRFLSTGFLGVSVLHENKKQKSTKRVKFFIKVFILKVTDIGADTYLNVRKSFEVSKRSKICANLRLCSLPGMNVELIFNVTKR
jgi:hypothetical protein